MPAGAGRCIVFIAVQPAGPETAFTLSASATNAADGATALWLAHGVPQLGRVGAGEARYAS